MNTSFNVVTNELNPQEVVDAINAMGVKEAIINGITTTNPLTGAVVQLVTILDCDRKTFNKIKNRVALKGYFISKQCY